MTIDPQYAVQVAAWLVVWATAGACVREILAELEHDRRVRERERVDR